MFVGHEFLAFALAGWGARSTGADRRTALHLGGIAAIAALLPDLDVAYAAATYATAVAGGAPLGWEAFWGVANGVHRVVTHPLPVGVVAALAFTAAAAVATAWLEPTPRTAGSDLPSGSGRDALAAVLATLFATAGVAALLSTFSRVVGRTPALVAAAFLLAVAVAGALVGRRADASTASLAAAAGVGFLSHPFGDVFLAVPPPLLSPFGPPVLTERVSLAADPTVEILAVLFVELAAVWLGVVVAFRLTAGDFARTDGNLSGLRGAIDVRSMTGVAYGAAVFVLPRPTVVDAHVLGFTIVPLAVVVGLWTGYSNARRGTSDDPSGGHRTGVAVGGLSALTALTVAAVVYLVVYLATPW